MSRILRGGAALGFVSLLVVAPILVGPRVLESMLSTPELTIEIGAIRPAWPLGIVLYEARLRHDEVSLLRAGRIEIGLDDILAAARGQALALRVTDLEVNATVGTASGRRGIPAAELAEFAALRFPPAGDGAGTGGLRVELHGGSLLGGRASSLLAGAQVAGEIRLSSRPGGALFVDLRAGLADGRAYLEGVLEPDGRVTIDLSFRGLELDGRAFFPRAVPRARARGSLWWRATPEGGRGGGSLWLRGLRWDASGETPAGSVAAARMLGIQYDGSRQAVEIAEIKAAGLGVADAVGDQAVLAALLPRAGARDEFVVDMLSLRDLRVGDGWYLPRVEARDVSRAEGVGWLLADLRAGPGGRLILEGETSPVERRFELRLTGAGLPTSPLASTLGGAVLLPGGRLWLDLALEGGPGLTIAGVVAVRDLGVVMVGGPGMAVRVESESVVLGIDTATLPPLRLRLASLDLAGTEISLVQGADAAAAVGFSPSSLAEAHRRNAAWEARWSQLGELLGEGIRPSGQKPWRATLKDGAIRYLNQNAAGTPTLAVEELRGSLVQRGSDDVELRMVGQVADGGPAELKAGLQGSAVTLNLSLDKISPALLNPWIRVESGPASIQLRLRQTREVDAKIDLQFAEVRTLDLSAAEAGAGDVLARLRNPDGSVHLSFDLHTDGSGQFFGLPSALTAALAEVASPASRWHADRRGASGIEKNAPMIDSKIANQPQH